MRHRVCRLAGSSESKPKVLRTSSSESSEEENETEEERGKIIYGVDSNYSPGVVDQFAVLVPC